MNEQLLQVILVALACPICLPLVVNERSDKECNSVVAKSEE